MPADQVVPAPGGRWAGRLTGWALLTALLGCLASRRWPQLGAGLLASDRQSGRRRRHAGLGRRWCRGAGLRQVSAVIGRSVINATAAAGKALFATGLQL